MRQRLVPTDTTLRPWLAMLIVVVSALGIVVTAITAVVTASDTARPGVTQLIFSSLLPLFGTWVGTVMAFYFAKENLAAATESTARLSGIIGASSMAADIMIPKAQITSRDLAAGEAADAVPLADLKARIDSSGKHRLPIIRADLSVAYIVSRAVITQFIAKNGALAAQTVADLVKDDELKQMVTAIAFVAPTDLIPTIRARIAAKPGCKDVFVTKDGKDASPVVGWITDSDLAAAS